MPHMFHQTSEARGCAHLAQLNGANVAQAYLRARDNQVDDPVVVVLDLRDERAIAVARSHFRVRGRIQTLIDDCREKQLIPTVIAALPHDEAIDAMTRVGPDAQKALSSTIPRSYYRVMTIAFGEHTHTACPEPGKVSY